MKKVCYVAALLQLKCEANSWKEAYTTKSVQITNYIKAKSTLRHIYMIQMYVYNSILAGRLGDCWLAPGRLLAGPWEGCWLAPGKAGWALGRLLLLAGPWEGCWVCWIADFCWSPSLGESPGTEWIQLTAHLWVQGGYVSQQRVNLRRSQYGHQCSMFKLWDILDFMLIRGYLWQNWINTEVSVNLTHICQAAGLVFSWFLLSKVVSWTGSTLTGEGLVTWLLLLQVTQSSWRFV